eukprot:scaffold41019_cov329-Skeletonema_marinoi.AAC.1
MQRCSGARESSTRWRVRVEPQFFRRRQHVGRHDNIGEQETSSEHKHSTTLRTPLVAMAEAWGQRNKKYTKWMREPQFPDGDS